MATTVRVTRRHDLVWVVACNICRDVTEIGGHQPTRDKATAVAREHRAVHYAEQAEEREYARREKAARLPRKEQGWVDFIDDVETYIRGGETVHTAAERRGMRADSLTIRLAKGGRWDLVEALRRNEIGSARQGRLMRTGPAQGGYIRGSTRRAA